MGCAPDCEAALLALDADRIAGLVQLLGLAAFAGLVAQLEAEIDKVVTDVRAGADGALSHARLHRLQGSSSALGLVDTAARLETAARLALAGQSGDAAALAAVVAALGLAVSEIAAVVPDFAAVHAGSRSKR
jgi:hypothetical protein